MAKAKKDKVKIPKKIAGVKIPKELRKAASETVAKIAAHPAIREIVATGLVAAAAALTEREAPKKQAKAPREEAEGASDAAGREASKARAAVKAAAGAMGMALLDEIRTSARTTKAATPDRNKGTEPTTDS